MPIVNVASVSYKSVEDPPLNEQQLKAIFEQHDTNRDGRLSKEELSKAFQRLGSRNPGWRVRRSLHHADGNADGSIGSDELDELVKYAVKQGYRLK